MTTYHVAVEGLEAQPAAVVREHVDLAGLPEFLGTAFSDVMRTLGAQGLAPAGPPFARYRPGADGFDVEAGFPTSEPLVPAGRVDVEMLPGGPTATVPAAPTTPSQLHTTRPPAGWPTTVTSRPASHGRPTSTSLRSPSHGRLCTCPAAGRERAGRLGLRPPGYTRLRDSDLNLQTKATFQARASTTLPALCAMVERDGRFESAQAMAACGAIASSRAPTVRVESDSWRCDGSQSVQGGHCCGWEELVPAGRESPNSCAGVHHGGWSIPTIEQTPM